ncbi:MAG: hypothetical protein KGH58_01940 [Candidatus Micrarchaeota archaeon]|nr:hypothetical protein [Candidatus Micrarchaeota archaeon]
MMGFMVPVVLSIGAIYALIPLMIIVALIAAAAGLSRGANIFQFFGFDALLGLSSGVGAGASGKGMISKSLKYSTDQQEKLMEAMRSATKSLTGKQRGVTRREINIGKSGITVSATAKQKEQSITAMKELMKKAGKTQEQINAVEAKTTKDVKGIMSAYRGRTTLAGSVIPDWMATKSRRIEKIKYTGPKPETPTKTGVGAPIHNYMRDAWDKETKSLSQRIKESKAQRDEAEKGARKEKIAATQKAFSGHSTFARRVTNAEAALENSSLKGVAAALGVSGAVPAAVFGYHGVKAIWDKEARKQIIAAYSQNPEVPSAPLPVNRLPSGSGGGSDWSDYARRALGATVKSYEAFFAGETLSKVDTQKGKPWFKGYAASRYSYEKQPKPKAPAGESESSAE